MSGTGLKVRLSPNTIQSIDSSTFTGSYQKLGTPSVYPIRIIKFTNNSNQLVTLSWNGVNDHEVLPAGSFLLLDVSANNELSYILEIPAQMQFWVKGSAGTGLFYLSSYYAK